jgi:hypothetical protein
MSIFEMVASINSPNPVLGVDGTEGTLLCRLGDKLIDAGKYDRVILIAAGVGGTSIVSWAVGGSVNHRIGVAINRAKSLGFTITHVMWMQARPMQGMECRRQTTLHCQSQQRHQHGNRIRCECDIFGSLWRHGLMPCHQARRRSGPRKRQSRMA